MLQQAALLPLLRMCRQACWWVEVETAGTIGPTIDFVHLVDRFNVSPKLANSGNELGDRYRPRVLDRFQDSGKAIWKFVVEEETDLDEIEQLVQRHRLSPVYVMPEGITAATIARRSTSLAQEVLARGWNLTTRLHILLYGNHRGV
jgi:organic radical activating enzyme